jgi:hypothetical protein
VAGTPRCVSPSKTINIKQFAADAGARTGAFFTPLEVVDVLIRSQAREIFARSHALASPADEAGRLRVMVEAGKADA